MSPTLKRILLFVLLFALAALLSLALYFAFRQALPSAPTPSPTATTAPSGQLPPAGERVPGAGVATTTVQALPIGQPSSGVTPPSYYQPQVVSQLNSTLSLFPSTAGNGATRYYDANNGKFYQILSNGSTQALSGQIFYNAQNVTWAKSANEAVIEYSDGSKILYNFDTQKQVTLPNFWQNFSFSPNGNQIAAKSIGLSTDNRWLVTENSDGNGTQLIQPLGDNADKVIVDWSPSRQTVALSQTGAAQTGVDNSQVLFIGLNNENFKATNVPGLDFQPQWSPTGQQLLYSVDNAASDFKPTLWIVDSYGDSIGNNRRSLDLNTWADKCAFQNDSTLYCAVPRSLPEGAGIEPAVAAGEPDDLYKIDLKTGLKTPIPLPSGQDFTFDTISYNAANNSLNFTDKNIAGLFQVNL